MTSVDRLEAETAPAPTVPAVDAPRLVTVISPGGGGVFSYVREVVQFRDLLYFMVRRDIRVRYAQTVLGFGWSVLQPFLQMVVFSVFFGGLAGISSGGIPYPVFSIVAVVPWTYFQNAVNGATSSLMGNSGLVSKVYFPRLLVPLSPIGAGLVDYVIGIALLLGVMGAYGRTPPLTAFLYLPVITLAAVLAAAAFSIWLSVLGVQYRDVRYIAPFLLQLMLFITPVIYVTSHVPANLRPFYAINPMVGVVSGSRAAFLKTTPMPWHTLGISFTVSIVLLALGLVYFRRVERFFADIA
jgi:lipopolysaccharide transport system permease protein